MTEPALAPDAEGFLPLEALVAWARTMTVEQLVARFPVPALELNAIDDQAARQRTESSFLTTQAFEPDDLNGTQRFPVGTGLKRFQKRIAFLRKRPGNPFPQMISVGRAINNDLALSAGSVSKMHGFFLREGDVWTFTDRRSTNGTLLNGVRLEPDKKYPIKDGDELRFGLELSAKVLSPQALYQRLRFA